MYLSLLFPQWTARIIYHEFWQAFSIHLWIFFLLWASVIRGILVNLLSKVWYWFSMTFSATSTKAAILDWLCVCVCARARKGRRWLTEMECFMRSLLIDCQFYSGFFCRREISEEKEDPTPVPLLVGLGVSEWLPAIGVTDTTTSFSLPQEALP